MLLFFEHTMKSTKKFIFKTSVSQQKTVNYHMGQLNPNWEYWTIQLHFEITFAIRARMRSTHKLWIVATFHSCLFDWNIPRLVLSWSVMSFSTPSQMRFRWITWGTLRLLFLSAEHRFSTNSIIKYLLFLVAICKFCKWCMHPVPQCPAGWKMHQVAIFRMLPSCCKYARSILSAVSTPTLRCSLLFLLGFIIYIQQIVKWRSQIYHFVLLPLYNWEVWYFPLMWKRCVKTNF